MNLKKLMGIWMAVLIVSLPLYTANALAATVRITKNTGTAGVDGFINARGDTWSVEAAITNAAEVAPEQVRLQAGQLTEPFNSCSSGTLGTVCSYESNLENGIREDNYPFTVNYQGVSQSGIIKADGSAPQVTGLRAEQKTDGTIDLSFTAADRGDGLAAIEVLNDANAVLQTVEVEAGRNELQFNGKLQGINSGEGVRVIKVKAKDRLGHETITSGVSFRADFIAPIAEKVNITALGRFIGITAFKSNIIVDLRETSDLLPGMVRVSSARTSLQNTNPSECLRDADEFNLWHCAFSEVNINPAETVSFDIYAEDRSGNSATASKSLSYTLDNKAPIAVFFGTERIFDGHSYVGSGNNRIVLKYTEEGAGITQEGIRANLQSVGGSVSQAPDYFNATSQEAYWNLRGGTGGARISLVKLQDLAGNEDPSQLAETGLIVDNTGPRIERLEILGVSEQNEHTFFQSQDQLKFVFTVREDSGLQLLVNLDKLVDNALLKYPARGTIPAGWLELTHDDGCERLEGKWECSLLVPEPLRSGTGREVDLEIKIRDTAGNEASYDGAVEPRNVERTVSRGKYSIKLLGLSEEEDPDFWEVQNVRFQPSFVDLDTVSLAPTRAQAVVTLTSPELDAEVLTVNLGRCEPKENAPKLRNTLFYGGIEPGGENNPAVNIALEFEPFDGRAHFKVGAGRRFDKAIAEYECQLEIFTKLGRRSVRVAEIQSVPLKVAFAFSKNGALDENLALKVKELKENDLFKLSNVLSYLATVVKFLNFAAQLIQIIVNVNQFIDLFATSAKTQIATFRTQPEAEVVGSEAWITAIKGACYSTQVGSSGTWEIVKTLQIPMNILACNPGVATGGKNPDGSDEFSWGLGWYGKYQRTILETYNLASGRTLLGVPASSLQENLWASMAGLCIPGIILNIEKLRELHCRKIICYGREVPAGIATIESCDKLYNLQLCEFVMGTSFDFILLGGFVQVGRIIQSAISSPLGLITLSETFACWNLCFSEYSVTDVQVCKAFTGINKAISIIDNIVGAVQTGPSLVGSQYCGQIDDIKLEELTGGQFLPKEEPKPAEKPEGRPSATPRTQPQTNI